jgi:hypothetical protein
LLFCLSTLKKAIGNIIHYLFLDTLPLIYNREEKVTIPCEKKKGKREQKNKSKRKGKKKSKQRKSINGAMEETFYPSQP